MAVDFFDLTSIVDAQGVGPRRIHHTCELLSALAIDARQCSHDLDSLTNLSRLPTLRFQLMRLHLPSTRPHAHSVPLPVVVRGGVGLVGGGGTCSAMVGGFFSPVMANVVSAASALGAFVAEVATCCTDIVGCMQAPECVPIMPAGADSSDPCLDDCRHTLRLWAPSRNGNPVCRPSIVAGLTQSATHAQVGTRAMGAVTATKGK